ADVLHRVVGAGYRLRESPGQGAIGVGSGDVIAIGLAGDVAFGIERLQRPIGGRWTGRIDDAGQDAQRVVVVFEDEGAAGVGDGADAAIGVVAGAAAVGRTYRGGGAVSAAIAVVMVFAVVAVGGTGLTEFAHAGLGRRRALHRAGGHAGCAVCIGVVVPIGVQ